MLRMRWLDLGCALVTLGVTLAGCGTKGDSVHPTPDAGASVLPTISVGEVGTTDAVLGVVTQADRIVFYVCGGASTYSTHTRWFKGTFDPAASEPSFSLTAAGWTVSGQHDSGGWTGELAMPSGQKLPWRARHTAQGKLEGLYQVMDGNCRTGVVIQEGATGDEPRVQGVWCDGGGQFAQVVAVRPVAISDQGIEVKVPLASGGRSLFVTPMIPAP